MSQVIEIVRANEDGSPSDSSITRDEWRAVVAADPTLVEFPIGGADDAVAARWIAHPKKKEVRYVWENGLVHTNYADEAMLAKTQEISRALKARVRDEGGEFLDDIDLSQKRGCGAAVFLLAIMVAWVALS